MTSGGAGARDLLVSLRPWQWIKNGVVLLPIVFARRFGEPLVLREGGLAFLAFCLLSSAVYVFNDVCDREADAVHPARRFRPIAAGRIESNVAVGLFAALACAGIAVLLPSATRTGDASAVLLAIGYLVVNLLYSWRLKRVAVVSAICVAGGFLIRVHLGGAMTAIAVSHWLSICVFVGALTVAMGKRLSDAVTSQGSSDHIAFLARSTAIAGASFVASYVAYTLSPRTHEVFGTHALVVSSPFVLCGVIGFFRRAREGRAADPTRVFLHDPLVVSSVLLYAASIAVVFATH